MKNEHAKVLTFPASETRKQRMIERLNALKAHYLELQALQDKISSECILITGESEEANGHTFNWLWNDDEMTAEELLAEMECNPSHLWRTIDSYDGVEIRGWSVDRVLEDEFID